MLTGAHEVCATQRTSSLWHKKGVMIEATFVSNSLLKQLCATQQVMTKHNVKFIAQKQWRVKVKLFVETDVSWVFAEFWEFEWSYCPPFLPILSQYDKVGGMLCFGIWWCRLAGPRGTVARVHQTWWCGAMSRYSHSSAGPIIIELADRVLGWIFLAQSRCSRGTWVHIVYLLEDW